MLVQRVLETARQINRRFGTAIMLVEQNIKTALGMAQRAYVMKSGRIVLEKPAAELLAARIPGGSCTERRRGGEGARA